MANTNGNGAGPKANGNNGRDKKGRFAQGNPGGPGSPHRSKLAKIKRQFLEAATEERVHELLEILWAKALDDQEQWAIIEVLNRLYGKPDVKIDVGDNAFALVNEVREGLRAIMVRPEIANMLEDEVLRK